MGRFDRDDDAFVREMGDRRLVDIVRQADEPRPEVTLSGNCNGNALSIVGFVKREMRRAGCSRDWIQQYHDEALSSDYSHVINTTCAYVDVVG